MAYAEIIDKKIVLTIPVEKVTSDLKKDMEEILNNYPIEVIPIKKLSAAQNGLIHVLLKQYGEELGNTMIEQKEIMKEQFAIDYDLVEFSTSRCDMQLANEFIAYIIEHAIYNDINLYIMNKRDRKHRHILSIDKVTERYIIACLRKRMCVITGKVHDIEHNCEVQLDHWENVNTIGGYEYCDGLKTRFLPLSVEMHYKKHNIGREAFKELYHIEGIWLNENLVKELKKVYTNHFKAFKEEEI